MNEEETGQLAAHQPSRRRGDDLVAHLGPALQLARVRRELSQHQLAERAGVSASRVSAWERGAGLPTLAYLGRLLSALEIGLADLEELMDRVAAPDEVPRRRRRSGESSEPDFEGIAQELVGNPHPRPTIAEMDLARVLGSLYDLIQHQKPKRRE